MRCHPVARSEYPCHDGRTPVATFPLPKLTEGSGGNGSGEGGIRTHETAINRLRDFQSRSFGQLGHLSAKEFTKRMAECRRLFDRDVLAGFSGVYEDQDTPGEPAETEYSGDQDTQEIVSAGDDVKQREHADRQRQEVPHIERLGL